MRKILFSLFVLVGSPVYESVAQSENGLENEFADDFYPVWQRAGEYLLEVAEAMPEDLYDYQPTEEVFTFAEQLMHTAGNLYFLNATYITGEELEGLELDTEGKSKEEIISMLKDAIATVDMSYQSLAAGEDHDDANLFNRFATNKRRVLLLMRDHVTHHRGQMIIYLRLNGIEPPAYVGW